MQHDERLVATDRDHGGLGVLRCARCGTGHAHRGAPGHGRPAGRVAGQRAGIEPSDNSRVLQGIIAGVGFLGAGTILKGDTENQVTGLTTAAGIWLTAAIGVAAGLGQEATAVLTTVLALIVLWAIPLMQVAAEKRAQRRSRRS